MHLVESVSKICLHTFSCYWCCCLFVRGRKATSSCASRCMIAVRGSTGRFGAGPAETGSRARKKLRLVFTFWRCALPPRLFLYAQFFFRGFHAARRRQRAVCRYFWRDSVFDETGIISLPDDIVVFILFPSYNLVYRNNIVECNNIVWYVLCVLGSAGVNSTSNAILL